MSENIKKIDKKIITAVVSREKKERELPEIDSIETICEICKVSPDIIIDIVVKSPLMEEKNFSKDRKRRPNLLEGKTYKISSINGEGKKTTFYITINDIIENNEKHPFELFIFSQDQTIAEWTQTFALMVTAIFRLGKDDSNFDIMGFIRKNLLKIRGRGYFDNTSHGYVDSPVSHIAKIIEMHLKDIESQNLEWKELNTEKIFVPKDSSENTIELFEVEDGKECPACGKFTLKKVGGCEECSDCGFMGSCG
jgi:ribonucleoside-diphosphate reductase alpha chain